MTVFSKVITGVKKRMPTATPTQNDDVSTSSSSSTPQDAGISSATPKRRVNKESPVAPDLRRFSDFINPFPLVQPGGYTKYYQARAAATAAGGGSDASSGGAPSPYALPALCELNQRRAPPHGSSRRPPTIQTSGLQGRGTSKARTSGSSSSSRSHQKAISDSHIPSQALAPILETSSEQVSQRTHTSHSRSHSARTPSSQPQAPLKRRKGRLLRTPSVEKDFAARGSSKGSPVGRASSVSSSQSYSSSSHHSSPSTDSHSSDSSVEYPRTPEEASPILQLPTYAPPSAFKFNDPYGRGKTRDSGISMGMGLGLPVDGDWEPFERPDSRSTYRTARTHFDDI